MSLRRNVIANYLGQGWTALMGIAFLPLYIEYLGLEAYGLIGLYAVVQVWLTLLDMGMTPTLTREMARFTAGITTADAINDLLRSLQIVCVALALLIGAGVWAASGWVASAWLRVEQLPVEEAGRAIAVMGWVVASRFIEGLYRGALLGLQRQVLLNALLALSATARWAGALAVLAWLAPSIEAFFIWQGLVSGVTVLALAISVYTAMPAPVVSPRFSATALATVWRFAGWMMATTLFSLLLTQADKILLSKLLPLEVFGRYMLAWTVAIALLQIAAPIAQAVYPRLTELIAQDDSSTLVDVYHRGAQLVSTLIIPAGLLLILFGGNILALWTGDDQLAHQTAPLLALLAFGAILNGLMQLPHMLQLAYGWPSFNARANFLAFVILIPALLWIVPRHGSIGAAVVWVILNLGYVLIAVYFMHRRLLPREKWSWYVRDVGLPALAAVCVMLLLRWTHPGPGEIGKPAELTWLAATGGLGLAAAALSASKLRRLLMLWYRR